MRRHARSGGAPGMGAPQTVGRVVSHMRAVCSPGCDYLAMSTINMTIRSSVTRLFVTTW